jgi:two-component system sensor histidine kinase MprB
VTLRTRVTLAAGFAVLLAVVAVSAGVYLVERGNLRDRVDQSLIEKSQQLSRHNGQVNRHGFPPGTSGAPKHLPLVQDVYMQLVNRDGDAIMVFDGRPLPVTAEVLAVARGERAEAFFDANVHGIPVRAYVRPAGAGAALQVGQSLTQVEQALRQLLLTLIVISVGAVGLAAVIGRLVASTAVAPVRRVAAAADTVAQTGELSHHIPVPRGDDLGRLAASFNTMLDALSESLAQQRQLVADASHELRTPLATVQTNVEVLARAEELAPGDRALLIRDTVAQIGELTTLVTDLVELARGDAQQEPFTLVDLDDLTRHVADIARRNYPSIAFRVDGVPSLIRGAPARVSRAVSNLIDNAAKWNPPGAPVEITVRDGAVTVRDHGPGVDPVDRPHVFDRFYRSPGARTMPGSGLGLAIVKQVADSHGGAVTAATAPDGGGLFVLQFPATSGGKTTAAPGIRNRLSLSS